MEVPILCIKRLFLFLAVLLVGCGNADSVAQSLADPTNQLPPHVAWNSYNVYRYEPGAANPWVKVIALGQVLNTLPVLGSRPVLLTHGWGGSIRNNKFVPLAQNLVDNNLATNVFGFEYDTQDDLVKNGNFCVQALQLLNANSPNTTWSFISHSMGGLVTRSAVQSGVLPIAATGNRVITLGVPHAGSPVADAVQTTQDAPTKAIIIVDLDQGGFLNADGSPCEVDLQSIGFTGLRTDSIFIQNLNANVVSHPQVNYFTIAGNVKGELQAPNDALKVTTDDGLVTIASANYLPLNALGSAIVPVKHLDLAKDSISVFPLVRQFLVQ